MADSQGKSLNFGSSRLASIRAQFEQKQMAEKAQKLLQLQSAKILNPTDSNRSNGGSGYTRSKQSAVSTVGQKVAPSSFRSLTPDFTASSASPAASPMVSNKFFKTANGANNSRVNYVPQPQPPGPTMRSSSNTSKFSTGLKTTSALAASVRSTYERTDKNKNFVNSNKVFNATPKATTAGLKNSNPNLSNINGEVEKMKISRSRTFIVKPSISPYHPYPRNSPAQQSSQQEDFQVLNNNKPKELVKVPAKQLPSGNKLLSSNGTYPQRASSFATRTPTTVSNRAVDSADWSESKVKVQKTSSSKIMASSNLRKELLKGYAMTSASASIPGPSSTSTPKSFATPLSSPSASSFGKSPTIVRSAGKIVRTEPPPPGTVECSICGRCFAEDRIAKHESICKKTSAKKRKIFDPTKMRVAGTEAEAYVKLQMRQQAMQLQKQGKKGKAPLLMGLALAPVVPTKPKVDWRKQHEDFIKTIRAAKEFQKHVASGGDPRDLPPPPPSDTSNYVQCPHCKRKFNPGVAERHIPKCTSNKLRKR